MTENITNNMTKNKTMNTKDAFTKILKGHIGRPINLETNRGRGLQAFLDWELEQVSDNNFRVHDFSFEVEEITSMRSRHGNLEVKIIK